MVSQVSTGNLYLVSILVFVELVFVLSSMKFDTVATVAIIGHVRYFASVEHDHLKHLTSSSNV